eukprot:TRINITY_DN758_c0_g2_i1.p1 TRINITY_DN758_c0_g2~~TRINITY_DN758_c0_g2_i1.p1  ORF type:complete len:172 (+),score=73.38 TRINITY_DN758_c0_g2_i1:73-588(+)
MSLFTNNNNSNNNNNVGLTIEQSQTELTTSLNEIKQLKTQADEISNYCKECYEHVYNNGNNQETTYTTQNYAFDLLDNTSYSIHKISLQFTNYLELQTKQLEQISTKINTINTRLQIAQQTSNRACFTTSTLADKNYFGCPKIQKIETNEISRTKWIRQVGVLKAAIDNIR